MYLFERIITTKTPEQLSLVFLQSCDFLLLLVLLLLFFSLFFPYNRNSIEINIAHRYDCSDRSPGLIAQLFSDFIKRRE